MKITIRNYKLSQIIFNLMIKIVNKLNLKKKNNKIHKNL